MSVTLADIRAAAEAIGEVVEETPCVHSSTLSNLTGAEVVLKFENLQFTGSFKDRGALNKLLSLSPAERQQGVIAMSAGNHAQAVAYHAQRLGIPTVIVMPRHTPTLKVEHTRAFGAEVILEGEGLDQSAGHALTLAEKRGLSLIHPYDDPQVIAGQGTITLEMLAAYDDLDALVIPVGGGGLISGNAIAAKELQPSLEIIGVETSRYPSMRSALAGEEPSFGSFSIAEGIAVKEPGRLTQAIVAECVDEILLVDEAEIEEAVLLFLKVEKTVVEGAGAVGLAALLKERERFRGRKVGLIISGGNIDMPLLSYIIQRGLVREGRLARIQVRLRDIPGTLARVTAIIAQVGANIVEVNHQRTFTQLPVQLAAVELMIQTRGEDQVQEVLAALTAEGYQATLLSPDGECLV